MIKCCLDHIISRLVYIHGLNDVAESVVIDLHSLSSKSEKCENAMSGKHLSKFLFFRRVAKKIVGSIFVQRRLTTSETHGAK